MKGFLFLVITILGISNFSFGQGSTCATSEILCDPTVSFSAETTAPDLGGTGCLGSSPNPAFYTLYIAESGDINIDLTPTSSADLDFAMWGPFTNPTGNCGATFPTGPIPSCSFNGGTNPERIDVSGALQGEFYILCELKVEKRVSQCHKKF